MILMILMLPFLPCHPATASLKETGFNGAVVEEEAEAEAEAKAKA